MPHNNTEAAPHDDGHVNIHEDYEIEYWTKQFGCTKEQLLRAVTKVGVSPLVVEIEVQHKPN